MTKTTLCASLFASLTLLGAPGDAAAAGLDLGNLLVAACSSGFGGDTGKAFEDVMQICSYEERSASDDHDACEILTGNPDHCADLTPTDEADEVAACADSGSSLQIDGTIDLPAGWSGSGSFTAEIEVEAHTSNVQKCDLELLNADGKGGTYVSEASDLTAHVSFTMSGSASFSGNGLRFTIDSDVSCELGVTRGVYRQNKVSRCKERECESTLVSPEWMMESDACWETAAYSERG